MTSSSLVSFNHSIYSFSWVKCCRFELSTKHPFQRPSLLPVVCKVFLAEVAQSSPHVAPGSRAWGTWGGISVYGWVPWALASSLLSLRNLWLRTVVPDLCLRSHPEETWVSAYFPDTPTRGVCFLSLDCLVWVFLVLWIRRCSEGTFYPEKE